jgi:flagellar biosynthesis GTPase FlhF
MAKKPNRFEGVLGEEPLILPTDSQADDEIVPGDEKSLSASEERALARCEQTIERGLRTFVEVGQALKRIRDARLYRLEYRTFEDYCAERWGYKRERAYEVIRGAEVVNNVRNFQQDDPPDIIIESHAKELQKLKEPEQQWQAWQKATERAAETNTKLTAKVVAAVVKELSTTDQPPQPAQLPVPASEPADLVNVRFQVPKGTKWIAIRHLVEALGGEIGNEKDDHNPNSPLERAYARISLQNIQSFVNSYRRVFLALEEHDEAIQRARREKTPSPLLQPLNEITAALEQMREDMVE